MIIKRILTVFILFSFLFFYIPSITVKANSGPPSNLRLTIINADFEYYFEILAYQESPLSNDQIEQALDSIYYNKPEEETWDYEYPMLYDMPEMLATFQDKDGYVSNTLYLNRWGMFDFEKDPDDLSPHQFIIWLNPPKQFKLMLIGNNDQVILSEVIQMSEYDYRVTWDLEGVSFTEEIQYDSGVVIGLIKHPLLRISTYIDFFVRLFVTLAIELGLLYFFGFRKNKSYLIALGVNLISQSILTIGTLFSFYMSRFSVITIIYLYIVGEFFIFSGEMIIYAFTLKEKPVHIRILYGFLANLLSMVIGLMVTLLIFGYIAR